MASITAAEFDEWCIYAQFNPFGPQAEERRTARICAVVANSMGGKKGGGQFTEADFMLRGREIDEDCSQLVNTLQIAERQA